MIEFADLDNLTNRRLTIDDASAVLSLVLIEAYHDLLPAKQFEDKLTGLASRLFEHSEGIKIDARRAFMACIAAYLMSTEPGAEIE